MMKTIQHTTKGTARLAAGIGAIALLAVTPQLARADGPAPTSVELQSVSVTPDSLARSHEIGVVRIAFDNAGAVAAREVVFQVTDESGTLVQQINDRGSFAPHATIVHTFDVPAVQSNDKVQVAAVKYVDGSAWTADGSHLDGKAERALLDTGN